MWPDNTYSVPESGHIQELPMKSKRINLRWCEGDARCQDGHHNHDNAPKEKDYSTGSPRMFMPAKAGTQREPVRSSFSEGKNLLLRGVA